MYGSSIATTWCRGNWPGDSKWPPPLCPAGLWLRRKTGKINATAGDRSQDTYVYPPFPPCQGFSMASSIRTTPRPYSSLTCWVWSQYPMTRSIISASRPYALSLSPSTASSWAGLTWTARPSRSAQRDLGLWGGCRAHGWARGNLWTGQQPHHVARCDEAWQVHPSYNWGHARYWIQPHIRCIGRACMEVQFSIRGIQYPSITGPQDPFQRATPLSYFYGGGGGFLLVTPPPHFSGDILFRLLALLTIYLLPAVS